MWNPIVEIRRSYDRLISTMGFFFKLLRWIFYIDPGPWYHKDVAGIGPSGAALLRYGIIVNVVEYDHKSRRLTLSAWF